MNTQMTTQKTCHCTVLIHRIEEMCYDCKLDYLKWRVGVNEQTLKAMLPAILQKQQGQGTKAGLPGKT